MSIANVYADITFHAFQMYEDDGHWDTIDSY